MEALDTIQATVNMQLSQLRATDKYLNGLKLN